MFQEIRFPEDISFNSINSIEFNTNIVKSKNGKEQRFENQSISKYSYKINYTLKNSEEIETVIAFFKITKGKANGFRFKDWLNYRAINQVIAIGDGNCKEFQLFKNYSISQENYTKKIIKPVKDTVQILLNGLIVNNMVDNINYSNGKVLFKSPPAENDIISANFEFDIPVRFNSDRLDIVLKDKDCFEINNLELIEIFDFD